MLRSLRARCSGIASAMLGVLGCCAGLSAAPITPGNLVIYRVGDGAIGLTPNGSPVFVDEFTPSGTLVQSLVMPSAGAGNKLVASGTASSEGLLTVSPDGRWVTITGYNSAIPGAASLPGTTGATVNRSVGVINSGSGVSTLTLFSDFASGSNPRAAVTTNGVDLWMSGGAGGPRYGTAGPTSTQLSTTLTNLRQINIFAGQLGISTASGTAIRLGPVGTGLPTTSGQVITNLPGFITNTGSPYAFFFCDLSPIVPGVDTLYVADDSALALNKWSLVAGTWIGNGAVGVDADDYRGVTGVVLPNGTVRLYATRRGGAAAAGGGELVTLDDASGYNGVFGGAPTVLAIAIPNTAYRGVGYIPGGACCDALGNCTLTYGAAGCGGTFLGLGTTCQPNLCPPPSAACCFPDGSCIVVNNPGQCNGTLLGLGTVCNPNPCPQPVMGACCVNGICGIRTLAQCQQAGGNYLGDGIPCLGVNCDEGACCLPNGNCVITTVPASCQQNGGVFQGFGTVCVPNPCPQPQTGACCKPDGSCSILTPLDCQAAGGGFQGFGSLCVPNPCPIVIQGACCINGLCFIRTPLSCQQSGGNYLGDGTACAGINCDEGACCRPNGSCFITTVPLVCAQAGGIFQGFGTVCLPSPCPVVITGACCFPDGTCQLVTGGIGACNGVYLGDGSACTPDICKGACCFPDGTCTLTGSGGCAGQFLGLNTVCLPNPCPQPVTCCNAQGACTIRINFCNPGEIQVPFPSCNPNPCPQPVTCCDLLGACSIRVNNCDPGEFQIPFQACQPNPCPQPEACCFPNGNCFLRLPAQCNLAGGNPQGPGTACTPNPCPQPGVCCAGSICLTLTQAQCLNVQPSIFVVTGLTCPGTLTSPCCKADYNHQNGISVQDLFDFLAAWFAQSPLADINGANGVTVQDLFDFLAAWFAGGCP